MANKERTIDNVRLFAEMVAKKQGWKLNGDKEHLEMVLEGLLKNVNRYGYYACPCRDSDGVKDEDADIICPCKYSKQDIEEFGHCYCGLFMDPAFSDSGDEPASIPERRDQ